LTYAWRKSGSLPKGSSTVSKESEGRLQAREGVATRHMRPWPRCSVRHSLFIMELFVGVPHLTMCSREPQCPSGSGKPATLAFPTASSFLILLAAAPPQLAMESCALCAAVRTRMRSSDDLAPVAVESLRRVPRLTTVRKARRATHARSIFIVQPGCNLR